MLDIIWYLSIPDLLVPSSILENVEQELNRQQINLLAVTNQAQYQAYSLELHAWLGPAHYVGWAALLIE